MDLFKWVQRTSTKMDRGLEHLFYAERLRYFRLFNLQKSKLWKYLIVVFQYLKGA